MSYFIAGSNDATGLRHSPMEVFEGSIFTSGNQKNTVSTGKSFVYSCSPSKAIDDVFIEQSGSDSWILLTGTPILDVNTDSERQRFAGEFFLDPLKVLRHQIDGHYAVIAYDAVRDTFLAASDWHSLIPVYLAITEGGPLFCSAELPLARLLQSKPDVFGFAQAIHSGTVWGGRTRFERINKLETCELVQVGKGNTISRKRYWEPQDEKIWVGSLDDVLGRWLGVMRDSIHRFTGSRGDSEVSSDITGGEDSRLIVALLHDLGLPFYLRVAGEPDDHDVVISRDLSKAGKMELIVEGSCPAASDDLSRYTKEIVFVSDAYGSFFTNISSLIHEVHYQPLEYKNIHFNGMLGGEEYRGAYYPHAKAFFPTASKTFNNRAFTKRKYLLDFSYNLLKIDDDEYMEGVHTLMNNALKEVEGFPSGTQVDHLVRFGQGCLETLHIKRPFYTAYGLRDATRSIYNIPPHMKKGGRLFKAATEMLFPEVAHVKTQAGVPTMRRTLLRLPLFLPEYYALFKKAINGIARQTLRATGLRAQNTVNARHHALAFHSGTIKWLFETEPYSGWFRSADTMLSGYHYNPDSLNELLEQARQPEFDRVRLLGRVVNQEIAYHYVYDSSDA